MPDPIRSGNIGFDFAFKSTPGGTPSDEDAPFRIVILGTFSGRAATDAVRAVQVDCDNFDGVFAALAPSVSLPSGAGSATETTISFSRLDDFHPDSLLRRIPSLASLVSLRSRLTSPSTAEAAAAEVRALLDIHQSPAPPSAQGVETHAEMIARLLGKPSSGTSTAPAAKSIVDLLIQKAVTGSAAAPPSPEQHSLLTMLDAELSGRLRSILHHHHFQTLEAAWRSLDMLVRESGEDVRLHVIDIPREALASQLSAHENPAVCPIGRQLAALTPNVILSTCSFGPGDIATLRQAARLAAACGTAFIAGAEPALAGCESFATQPDPHDWSTAPALPEFTELRRSPEAAHLGLAMPRFLLRLPYGKSDPIETFPFEEIPPSDPHDARLWGCSAFLCARLLLDAFAADGHDMDPCGAGGQVGDLPSHSYSSGGESRTTPIAEAWLTERAADAILARGLIPVLSMRGRDAVLIVSTRSVSDPARPLALRKN